MGIGQAALFIAAALLGGPAEPRLFSRAEPAMGTRFEIRLYARSEYRAERAMDAAFAVIHRLDRSLSDYDPGSEISRIGAAAGSAAALPCAPSTFEVLARARELAEATGGAFDPTVGSLTRLWRRHARAGTLPSPREMEEASEGVGYALMLLDRKSGTVRLVHPATRLDLGAIAKGYAADRALEVLDSRGCGAALVDAGGDLAIGGAPPGREGWLIGGADGPGAPPRPMVRCGVATSGDRFQSLRAEGAALSHIADPRTGGFLAGAPEVTAIAPDSATADALASAFAVLGPADAEAIARTMPGVSAVFRLPDGTLRRIGR